MNKKNTPPAQEKSVILDRNDGMILQVKDNVIFLNDKEIRGSFQFWPNYFIAALNSTNPSFFLLSIVRFFYEGFEPTFDSLEDCIQWSYVRPSIERSRRQADRSQGAPLGNKNNPYGRKGKNQSGNQSGKQSANQSGNQTNRSRNRNRRRSIINKEYVEDKVDALDREIKSFVNPELSECFSDYLRMRRQKGKPLKTTRGVKTAYAKLIKVAGDDLDLAKEICNQSVDREWMDFYPINKVDNGSNIRNTEEREESQREREYQNSL